MRILYITEWYPPYSFGGAGVYIEKLTKELNKLGLEIHIIAPGYKTKSTLEEGIFVHRFKTVHIPFLSLPLFIHNYSKDIENLINKYQIDIIHSNDYVGFPINTKLPIICTAHHLKVSDQMVINDFVGRIRFKFVRKWEESVFEKSQKIICVSKYTSEQLAKFYPEYASKSMIIPDGVDIKRFSNSKKLQKDELTKRYGLNDGLSLVFLPGGARGIRKGGDYLVKAIPDVVAKNPDTIFIFSGSGWEKPLRNLAEETNSSRYIILTGELTEKELICLYKCSDIICFPSLLEGFGLVVLEAMASKTPIVASAVGEIPNIIADNKDGLLVHPKDPIDIAKKINLLLKDKVLRDKLVNNGWKKVQKYSWKKAAEKTLDVYKNLLE